MSSSEDVPEDVQDLFSKIMAINSNVTREQLLKQLKHEFHRVQDDRDRWDFEAIVKFLDSQKWGYIHEESHRTVYYAVDEGENLLGIPPNLYFTLRETYRSKIKMPDESHVYLRETVPSNDEWPSGFWIERVYEED